MPDFGGTLPVGLRKEFRSVCSEGWLIAQVSLEADTRVHFYYYKNYCMKDFWLLSRFRLWSNILLLMEWIYFCRDWKGTVCSLRIPDLTEDTCVYPKDFSYNPPSKCSLLLRLHWLATGFRASFGKLILSGNFTFINGWTLTYEMFILISPHWSPSIL